MLTFALNPHAWPADVRDSCGNVFGLALRTAQPAVTPDARVLEIGCAEFDWLSKAKAAWPAMTFTGIDWRKSAPKQGDPPGITRIQGDVMTAAFAPESFDWIVGVSSLEHIGLGHYKGDPPNPDGDTVTFRRIYEWLTPGGWLYFDVPWNVGEAYEVVRTSHRVYDDATMQSRLLQGFDWTVRWTAVTGLHGGAIVHNPVRLKGGEHFYYRMVWIQKGVARHAA